MVAIKLSRLIIAGGRVVDADIVVESYDLIIIAVCGVFIVNLLQNCLLIFNLFSSECFRVDQKNVIISWLLSRCFFALGSIQI